MIMRGRIGMNLQKTGKKCVYVFLRVAPLFVFFLFPCMSDAEDHTTDDGASYSFDGQPDISYANEYIGYSASGTFYHGSGKNSSDALYLGYMAGSSGTYNFGGGALSTSEELIGRSGSGIINQSGGGNTVSGNLRLGCLVGGSGTYNLAGGSVSAGNEFIGEKGYGIFRQTGGSNQVNGFLYIGYYSGSSGEYSLGGGNLRADKEYIGCSGSGKFFQTDGTNTANEVVIGGNSGGSGAYIMSGGVLDAGTFSLLSGTFKQTGGTLSVDGSLNNHAEMVIAGNVIASGGFINGSTGVVSGTGSITGQVTNSGAFRPGCPTGALSVLGSYSQGSGGELEIDISGANSCGRLFVTGTPGTAVLGGSLRPVLLNGYVPAANQVFADIITASGGVTGTFETIIGRNLTPTLFWQPVYGLYAVDLTLARNYTNSALSLTPNLTAVGTALNALAGTATGDFNTALNAIDNLPTAGAVSNALKQISAEKASAIPDLVFAGSNFQKRVLSRRITDLRHNDPEYCPPATLPGYLDISNTINHWALTGAGDSDFPGLWLGEGNRGIKTGIYLEPAVIFGGRSSTADQTGYDFTIAGFLAGVDYRVRDDVLVGLATGYSHTSADFHDSGGSLSANTWPITLYAAYMPSPFYVYGSLGYSLSMLELDRDIRFGDIVRRATSSPDGHLFNAYTEAGYDLGLGPAVLTPMASLSYARLWLDGFTENGADSLNLIVDSRDVDSLQSGVGARLALPLSFNNFALVPQIHATYHHEFSDSGTTDARFSQSGLGPVFTFTSANLGRDFGVVGFDVTLLTRKDLRFRIDYSAEVGRSDWSAHYISGGLKWEF